MVFAWLLFAFCVLPFANPARVLAQAVDPNLKQQACNGANFGSNGTCNDSGFQAGFKSITNVLIFLVGAISVLMVIIGGIRYVTSAGNEQSTKGAKDTILFAIVGVIVAFLAFAIVNFIINKL